MSENIEQKCLAKGVKLTDQRKIIAKIMSESNDHPDVDELYNRVSKILKNLRPLIMQMYPNCVKNIKLKRI